MKTDGETKPAVDPRLITGLTEGREALFLPGRRPVERRLVSVNPSHARHVREFKPMEEQNPRLTTGSSPVHHRFITGLSPGREALFVPGCRPVE